MSEESSGYSWAKIPSEVFLSEELTHADVRVYAYLVWRQGQKSHSWAKIETMANDIGMSKSTVKRSISNLERNDWIRRSRRFERSSETFAYERQSDCRSAKRNVLRETADDLYDGSKIELDELTGETNVSSQVERHN